MSLISPRWRLCIGYSFYWFGIFILSIGTACLLDLIYEQPPEFPFYVLILLFVLLVKTQLVCDMHDMGKKNNEQ